jgi:hypothetical protein
MKYNCNSSEKDRKIRAMSSKSRETVPRRSLSLSPASLRLFAPLAQLRPLLPSMALVSSWGGR